MHRFAHLVLVALVVGASGCVVVTTPEDDGQKNDPSSDPSSQVEVGSLVLHAGVVVDQGYQYDVLSGDYQYTYGKWLLFEDGSMYFAIPRMHLGEFDPDASKAESPNQWGEWKTEGSALVVRHTGGDWTSYDDWFELTVASAGDTLDGTYAALDTLSSSTGENEYFATGWKVVTFTPDGHFKEASGGSVTDENGTVRNASQLQGSYEIQGLTMVTRFDDGTERKNTLLLSSDAKKTIFVNGVELILK